MISAAEVVLPGNLNLRDMCLNDGLGVGDLLWREASRSFQMDNRREPEFGLSVRVRHVNVDARLFPGEEEKPEGAIANDCGCHVQTLADSCCVSKWRDCATTMELGVR